VVFGSEQVRAGDDEEQAASVAANPSARAIEPKYLGVIGHLLFLKRARLEMHTQDCCQRDLYVKSRD
jgi:hypothetical protein